MRRRLTSFRLHTPGLEYLQAAISATSHRHLPWLTRTVALTGKGRGRGGLGAGASWWRTGGPGGGRARTGEAWPGAGRGSRRR